MHDSKIFVVKVDVVIVESLILKYHRCHVVFCLTLLFWWYTVQTPGGGCMFQHTTSTYSLQKKVFYMSVKWRNVLLGAMKSSEAGLPKKQKEKKNALPFFR